MGIVTLVSGGIDSTVMAKIIKNQGEEVIPIFVDYGQLAAEKEWNACQQLFYEIEMPDVIKADLNGYGKLIPSGLTDKRKNIYHEAFLPGRNMLFLLIGSAYAHHLKEKNVAIGLLSEDAHLFPDQTEEFIVNANFTLNSAMDDTFSVITPLINFSKNQVIKLAKHYDIPLEKTYSCHSGLDRYCGECVSCQELINSGVKNLFPQFIQGE